MKDRCCGVVEEDEFRDVKHLRSKRETGVDVRDEVNTER